MRDNAMFLFQKVHTWCTSFQKGEREEYEMYYQVVFRRLLDEHGLLLSHMTSRTWSKSVADTFTLVKVTPQTKTNIIFHQKLYEIFDQYINGLSCISYYNISIIEDNNLSLTIRCYIEK